MLNSQPPVTPRLYEILQSLNNTAYSPVNPYELVELTRNKVFDFPYYIDESVNKEELESNILRHFLMRRIGMETYAYWKMRLIDKINEIMPKYNKLFNSFSTLTLSTGKIISATDVYNSQNANNYNSSNALTRASSDTVTHDTKDETEGSIDSRVSDTPQNSIESVKSGEYVSNYGYDTTNNSITRTGTDTTAHNGTDTTAHSGTDTNIHTGTDTHTTIDQLSTPELLEAITKYNSEIQSIYTLIYRDLDDLFLFFM